MGNNVIWYLLALGIGTVFLVALLASQPDDEIRYRRVAAADQLGSDAEQVGRPRAAGQYRRARRLATRKDVRRFSHL